MARLVKIAKELNVGTSTIVQHLLSKGFEIENKPTAKVSEEMYSELLKEFQSSIAVKEQADQLIIGSRIGGKQEIIEEEKHTPTVVKHEKVEEKKPVEKEPEKKEKKETTEEKVDGRIELDKKLKVVGKIDLEKKKEKAPSGEDKKEEV